MMRSLRSRILSFALCCCCLLVLLSACDSTSSNTNQTTTNPDSTGTPSSPAHTSSATPTHTTTSVPQTSCPANGSARAAVMPPLTLGTHQNIVYLYDQATNPGQVPQTFNAGYLKRYDITTGSKTIITSVQNMDISQAQVSNDGQWVLFVAHSVPLTELQLVRMDGQELQTLYCISANQGLSNVQWSFNQRNIVFNVTTTPNTPPVTYLLDTTNGQVQQELLSSPGAYYSARTWLDNTRVYMIGAFPNSDAPLVGVFVLDTSKGANQQGSNLQKIASVQLACGDFDSSYDLTQLYVANCVRDQAPNNPGPKGPSSITVQAVSGGLAKTIYSNATEAVTTIRAVSSTTLFFIIDNLNNTAGQNGLWKMNTDGSGIQELLAGYVMLCPYSQDAWSNLSRNGQFYAAVVNGAQQNSDSWMFGSVNGGTPTTFATVSSANGIGNIVGWTTM